MSSIDTLLATAVHILDSLQEQLKKLLSGGDNKAIQKIVVALGHMCAKETSIPHLNIALSSIFSLCRCKVSMKFYFSFIPVIIYCNFL